MKKNILPTLEIITKELDISISTVSRGRSIKHWFNKKIYHFTSITELCVYESIAGL